jgi:AcrR family transcriptional regulator
LTIKLVQRPLTEPPPPPFDPRMVRSRAALRNALLALLQEESFDQIRIRDITTRANTGYATFYRHYESKESLLNDLAAEQMRELIRLTYPILHSRGSASAALAICRYVDEHRAIWSALLNGGAAAAMREEFRYQSRQTQDVMPLPNLTFPKSLSIGFGAAATVEVLAWWLSEGRQYRVEEVAAYLDRLVIEPVVTDKERQAP